MNCILCNDGGDAVPLINVSSKGLESLKTAYIERGDSNKQLHFNDATLVHEKCRKNYVNKKSIRQCLSKKDNGKQTIPKRKERSSVETCLYCNQELFQISKGNSTTDKFHRVTTASFKPNAIETCRKRNDYWGQEVLGRLTNINDCIAANVCYHKNCYNNFNNFNNLPVQRITSNYLNKRRELNTQSTEDRLLGFQKAVDYLKSADISEPVSVQQLCDKMACCGCEPYSVPFMKKKLIAFFGDSLDVISSPNKPDRVVLKTSISSILDNFYQEQIKKKNLQERNVDEEKIKLLETAAKLIRNDVQKIIQEDNKTYNIFDHISCIEEALSYIPVSLQIFLSTLFLANGSEKIKISIGQAMMQAICPRKIIAPLQISLAIQLHHKWSSKLLIRLLHSLGFCSSYTEVLKFERSSATVSNTELPINNSSFVQYVADNADHNLCTLDGKDTFHGMGIIAAITPSFKRKHQLVPRVKVTDEDIKKAGEIPILSYNINHEVLCRMFYEEIIWPEEKDCTRAFDLLWLSSWFLKIPRPQWMGCMQAALVCDTHPGRADIVFLPMIDLSSSNESCIYSTMRFIALQSERYGYSPVLTFDQPLWWKASLIVASATDCCPTRKIVLKLGGFHMLMNFIGCIGHLMEGSGIEEIFDVIFASNTVTHLLTGKAISRAIRAHLTLEAVLYFLLHEDTVECESEPEDQILTTKDVSEIGSLFKRMINGECSIDAREIESNVSFKKLLLMITKNENEKGKFRVGKFWINYMEMVTIMRTFIKAERCGNWNLHLTTVKKMLPFFASAGHNNYLKSSYLYLQNMINLPITNPNLESKFQSGHHVIRKCNRYWAGLSSDLVIEQELMRSMKASGGFTRRTGITEVQRLVWVMSRPICAEINSMMMNLTEIQAQNSDQHQENKNARIKRDCADTQLMIDYLKDSNPFKITDNALLNITTGVKASHVVNVDQAKVVGETILQKMKGLSLKDFTARRVDQCTLMSDKIANTGPVNKYGNVDATLLFQRIILVENLSKEESSNYFKFELCTHPLSLFDNNCFLRNADKAELAKVISAKAKYSPSDKINLDLINSSCGKKFVLDGGALLHKLPWSKDVTFESIYERYFSYISIKYGNEATVIFDGYNSSSTKHMTHLKRAKCIGREVIFTPQMKITTTKDEFLSSVNNKARFLMQLAEYLTQKGISVINATGDADLIIVQTAIRISFTHTTVIIADDTDVLVLLLHYSSATIFPLFMKSESKKGKGCKVWDITCIRNSLGNDICQHILFAHAFVGCDTTSKPFGIGKSITLKLLNTNTEFIEFASQFYNKDCQTSLVDEAGEKAMTLVYGGDSNEGIDKLRFKIFEAKVKNLSHAVKPQDLPPTKAALKFHSRRVYLQVQSWLGVECDPLKWGWTLRDDNLYPETTDLPPAPTNILKSIRCGCKGVCDNLRCSCRKNGIDCSVACKNCKGVSCKNITEVSNGEEELSDAGSDDYLA